MSQPLALDESLQSYGDMLRIVETGACEVVGLKIGRVGGLTVAAEIRDLCVGAGIQMNIEDTAGEVTPTFGGRWDAGADQPVCS